MQWHKTVVKTRFANTIKNVVAELGLGKNNCSSRAMLCQKMTIFWQSKLCNYK
jgi:hypothetical protein